MIRTQSCIQITSAKKIVQLNKIIGEKFTRYKMGSLKAKDKSFHLNINMKINYQERCQNQYK